MSTPQPVKEPVASRINVPIMLLAIVLSTFLWFVRFGQDLLMSGTVPVVLTTANVVGLTTSKLAVTKIPGFKVQLQGPAELVGKAESDPGLQNQITVDLTSARPGTGVYPVQYSGDLRRLDPSPKMVQVTIEEIITKQVPVVVELKGKLSDPNSNLESYPTSENSATVTASKSIADQITAARAVLQVNQVDPTNPLPQDSILVAIDAKKGTQSALIEPERVTITPIVIAAHIQKTALVSPVITGTPAVGYIPEGAKLNPKEVQVSGPTTTLVNMGAVKTEPIDITGLTSTKWFDVKLVLPTGTTSPTKVIHVRYDVVEDPAVKRAKNATQTPTQSAGLLPGAQP